MGIVSNCPLNSYLYRCRSSQLLDFVQGVSSCSGWWVNMETQSWLESQPYGDVFQSSRCRAHHRRGCGKTVRVRGWGPQSGVFGLGQDSCAEEGAAAVLTGTKSLVNILAWEERDSRDPPSNWGAVDRGCLWGKKSQFVRGCGPW